MPTANLDTRTELYVSGYSFDQYLSFLRRSDPQFHSMLSRERCLDAERQVAEWNRISWEFEGHKTGGRGAAYNLAQKTADNRKVGMATLLQCFGASPGIHGQNLRVLDVLGGDGTLARFSKGLGRQMPTIYTADISKFMIDACHVQALPCIRQPATCSLFRDDALDGVLIAYGSHHLNHNQRQLAAREAYRTLRAGGRLVLHDFEIGGRSARWFDSVVHPYSRTGHPHAHFSRPEMQHLLTSAGFCDVRVFTMHDPFTLRGNSPAEARHKAVMHMYDMYDLIRIEEETSDIELCLERYITETLGGISVQEQDGSYTAEIPREALVAVGTKPSGDS